MDMTETGQISERPFQSYRASQSGGDRLTLNIVQERHAMDFEVPIL